MSFISKKSLFAGFVAISFGTAACTTEVPPESSDPVANGDEANDGAEGEDVGTSQQALPLTCSNICSVGSVLACARFGAVGGVACGFGSIMACATVCAERGACAPGYRKVRFCGGGRAPHCTFVCRQ